MLARTWDLVLNVWEALEEFSVGSSKVSFSCWKSLLGECTGGEQTWRPETLREEAVTSIQGRVPWRGVAGLGVKLRGPGFGLAEGPRERGFWLEGQVSGMPFVGEEGVWGRPAVLSVRECRDPVIGR